MAADRVRALLFLLLAAVAPLAAAQSIGDLKDVQGEIILLRAQAAKAQAQAALQAAQGAGGMTADDGGIPVVRGVYGRDSNLYATFLYANGSTVDAGAKSRIPGGYTVARVSATSVTLVRGGRTYEVGFSDRRPMLPTAPVAAPADPSAQPALTP